MINNWTFVSKTLTDSTSIIDYFAQGNWDTRWEGEMGDPAFTILLTVYKLKAFDFRNYITRSPALTLEEVLCQMFRFGLKGAYPSLDNPPREG